MVFSLGTAIRALVVAFVVYVACLLLGGVVAPELKVPIIVSIGAFVAAWAAAFAVAAGLWYYFSRTGL